MKIVGIGASAGGVEAIRAFFEQLPDDTDASYVIIQHLSPDYKSMMDELLSGHTRMPVTVVQQRTRMQPNHIYLMPGDKNITVENGELVLEERQDPRQLNLPIDRFFHSLGNALGEEAIAVVLSGSGTDGSRGVRTIKENGGLVLVQDPASAKFNGMPLSAIELKIADSVLDPAALADELARILKRTTAGNGHLSDLSGQQPTEEPTFFERILDVASDLSGIDFRDYRESTLRRRIEKRMLLRNCAKLEDYYQLLQKEAEEAVVLYEEFLIGVTRFFRDPETFGYLNEVILPRLFGEREQPGEPLRIWVPGCSTGEEAYSIALLCHQYARENGLPPNYKIFATDVDKTAVKFAGTGAYPAGIAADLPVDLLSAYFRKGVNDYQVIDQVRDQVLFAVQDLLNDPPFINMDLISCRNLLIYLTPAAKQKVLSTLHFALNQNGVLLLGPSESLGGLKNAFQEINRSLNIFTCRKEVPVAPPRRSGHYGQTVLPEHGTRRLLAAPQSAATKPLMRDDYQDPFSRYLIEHYGPDCLFLNRELDILYLKGRPERFLQFPKAIARMNLKKMLDRRHLLLFREGVRQALSTGLPQRYQDVRFKTDSGLLHTQIRFLPVQLPSIEAPLVLTEIEILSAEQVSAGPETKTERNKDQVEVLERELGEAENRASKLVNELEATNEELQASNRELLASNEELQSTNEELQSVNEELYTVNSELQAKNEALITANSDINNLLRSTEIGTIFLDNDLRIRRFTPAIHQQFHLLESDLGRPITHFTSVFPDLNIGDIAQRVFDTLDRHEEEIADQAGNHYFMRILPYRTPKNHIKGLVITFININELVKAREKLLEAAQRFQAMFRHSTDPIIILDDDFNIEQFNRPFGSFEVEKIHGQSFLQLLPGEQDVSLKKTLEEALQQNQPKRAMLSFDIDSAQPMRYQTEIIPSVSLEKGRANRSTLLLILKEGKE